MKTRQGFVSNSSSSSYYITFTGNKVTRKDLLLYMWDNIDGIAQYDLKHQIDSTAKAIAATKAEIAESKKKTPPENKFEVQMLKIREEHVKGEEQYLKTIKGIQVKLAKLRGHEFPDALKCEMVELALKRTGVKLKRTAHGMELGGETSMHNDFDDMPNALKQMALTIMFDHPALPENSTGVYFKRDDTH